MPTPINIRKIFNPDIVFNDSIKSCWCDNVETINRQLPLHKDLKAHGIYALNIRPTQEKEYFVFCLPINKDWKNEDLSKWKQPVICFDIITCHKFKLTIQLMDDQKASLLKVDLDIPETEDWVKQQIPLGDVKPNNARVISFSGSVLADNFLIKGIVLKEK